MSDTPSAPDPVTPASAGEPASDRVRLGRKPARGRHDRATIDAILDEAIVGHVGWVLDGQPYVTPTTIWRQGDRLFWHGSVGSRMLRATKGGAPVCMTATLLDGLVLARSGTNHSVNYRSVMVLGQAHETVDETEKLAALEALIEHVYPGRWDELRPATAREIRETTILWMDLTESSAKLRAEGAHDDVGDESWPVWAGVVPVRLVAGAPEPEEHVAAGAPAPEYLPGPGRTVTGHPLG